MNRTDLVESQYKRSDIPAFRPGDSVKVHVRVVEGTRERVQIFQGVVIRRQGGGLRETFTVRKISFGVGVERTFPVHSPSIAKVEVVSFGMVRRAKLYYLRDLRGKKARIKERRMDDPKAKALMEAAAATAAAAAAAESAEAQAEDASAEAADEAASEAPQDSAATDDSAAAETATEEAAVEEAAEPEAEAAPVDEASTEEPATQAEEPAES